MIWTRGARPTRLASRGQGAATSREDSVPGEAVLFDEHQRALEDRRATPFRGVTACRGSVSLAPKRGLRLPMPMKTHCSLALIALVAASACASEQSRSAESSSAAAAAPETLQVCENFGSIENLHELGGIFLASQPSAADLERMREHGVKTVINLRHETEMTAFDEAAVVSAAGMEYVNLPWRGAGELTDDVLDRGRELLNACERPILLHCASASRVGAIWLAWRATDGRLEWDAAVEEARQIGLKGDDLVHTVASYVERRNAGM